MSLDYPQDTLFIIIFKLNEIEQPFLNCFAVSFINNEQKPHRGLINQIWEQQTVILGNLLEI